MKYPPITRPFDLAITSPVRPVVVIYNAPPCQPFSTWGPGKKNNLKRETMDRIKSGIERFLDGKGTLLEIMNSCLTKEMMAQLPHTLNDWEDFATLRTGEIYYWSSRKQLWIKNA